MALASASPRPRTVPLGAGRDLSVSRYTAGKVSTRPGSLGEEVISDADALLSPVYGRLESASRSPWSAANPPLRRLTCGSVSPFKRIDSCGTLSNPVQYVVPWHLIVAATVGVLQFAFPGYVFCVLIPPSSFLRDDNRADSAGTSHGRPNPFLQRSYNTASTFDACRCNSRPEPSNSPSNPSRALRHRRFRWRRPALRRHGAGPTNS